MSMGLSITGRHPSGRRKCKQGEAMENEPKAKAEREIDLEQEVLDEAFQFMPGDRLDLEKKILSIAFLLEACTGEGNEPLDGTAACGFGEGLRGAARDAARLRRQLRRLHRLDGWIVKEIGRD